MACKVSAWQITIAQADCIVPTRADEISRLWSVSLWIFVTQARLRCLISRCKCGCIDIIGMCNCVGEKISGTGHAHHVVNEGSGPCVDTILVSREDFTRSSCMPVQALSGSLG